MVAGPMARASERELQRLIGRIDGFTPHSGLESSGSLSAAETGFFLDAVVAVVHHLLNDPTAKGTVLDLVTHEQRTVSSQEVVDLNERLTTAMHRLAGAIRSSPAWSAYSVVPNPNRAWFNPWDPHFGLTRSFLSTPEFVDHMVTEMYTGKSYEAVQRVLSIVAGDASGLNGILPGLLERDAALSSAIMLLFDDAGEALARLRTLFEFDPVYNGARAAHKLLGIYAAKHPELQGRGALDDRMVVHMWRDQGMPFVSFREVQDYCAQTAYQVSLAREAADADAGTALAQTSDSNGLTASIAPEPIPIVDTKNTSLAAAVSLAAALTDESHAQRIVRARVVLNEAWVRRFQIKDRVKATGRLLAANEEIVMGIAGPVATEDDLSLRLGRLALLAVEDGLNTGALNAISQRQAVADGQKESYLQQLSRHW